MAYRYCYAGAAHKTQDRVRKLLDLEYDDQPDGLAGNEDCGQMSAWYLVSSLGFYAVDPVSGNYVFGTPLFDRAEVQLENDKTLVVEAKRNSRNDQHIQSVLFNGKPYTKLWFRHADVANGATIVFTLSGNPSEQFGSGEGSTPPSINPRSG